MTNLTTGGLRGLIPMEDGYSFAYGMGAVCMAFAVTWQCHSTGFSGSQVFLSIDSSGDPHYGSQLRNLGYKYKTPQKAVDTLRPCDLVETNFVGILLG